MADLINFNASKKWLQIPVEIRKKLEGNVFCSSCKGTTTIIDYSVHESGSDVVLRGFCKTCGHKVARVIDME